jgi:hypothetical protein
MPALPVLTRWVGPAVVAVASVAMLAWTWRTWPDVLIDFGKELYIPWQLARGQVLYRDVAYFLGPLSPYINALFFRLFGASLSTLVVANLVVLAAITALLYRLLAVVANRIAATAACLVFVFVFAYGQLIGIGNFNYVCPYVHEVTHGLLLSLLCIAAIAAYGRRGGAWLTALAGLALGAVFLTRAEMFAAAAAGATVGLGGACWLRGGGARRRALDVAAFVGATCVPPLLSTALLSLSLPVSDAVRGTLGSWPDTLSGEVARVQFFRIGMGLDDLAGNTRALLLWTGAYTAVFLPVAVVALLPKPPARTKTFVSVAAFVAAVAALSVAASRISWLDAPRPLPVIMLICLVAVLIRFIRSRHDFGQAQRALLALVLIVFALVLLGKMLLLARVHHYGFVLGMPAALILVVALVAWLPQWITRRGGAGGVFRAAAIGVLLVFVAACLNMNRTRLAAKTYRVGSGADAFWADARGAYVRDTLAEIGRRLRPPQTLAVLPEGAMINFLSRRDNPTPYVNFMPTEFVVFGEQRIIAAFEHSPPDYILLVHKETPEFGARFFGRDYAQRFRAWIDAHYTPIGLLGAPPLVDERFGVMLLQRGAPAR